MFTSKNYTLCLLLKSWIIKTYVENRIYVIRSNEDKQLTLCNKQSNETNSIISSIYDFQEEKNGNYVSYVVEVQLVIGNFRKIEHFAVLVGRMHSDS